MSVIWCGGEDIDFNEGLIIALTTSATYFRSAYSRCAITPNGNGFSRSTVFASPITSGWISSHIYFVSSALGTDDNFAIGFGVRGATKGIYIGNSKITSGRIAIFKYDGVTNTELAMDDGVTPYSELHKWDIQLINYGASGTVKVFYDTTLILEYTGDLSISGVTGFDCVAINQGGGTNEDIYISEIIVADEDTRLMSLKTLAPAASGDASEWTNGYGNIDEATLSDADTVYTATADQNFQCNLTGMPAGDFICKGVKICARMTDGVGGMGVQMGIKTNSTLDFGDTITLGGVWDSYEELYQNNPVTSNRFTPAEIEALQLAFKSVAV